jgi:hypothetical protein
MALVETLVTTIGASLAKSLLNVWLKENPVVTSTITPTIDLLKTKTDDYLSARRGDRAFVELGDKIAKSLEPVFTDYMLGENSYESVAFEVSKTLEKSKISSKLLSRLNYSPAKLLKHIHEANPGGAKNFSELETALYNRSLDLASQYIVDLASNLPDYTSQNFTEILQRLDDSMDLLNRVLLDLQKLRAISESSNRNREFAEFERDYRASVVRKFDRINLFGADVSRRAKRYQLTMAYVSLDVVKSDEKHYYEDDYEIRVSVQTALGNSTHAAIIGEAGSGKTTLLHWLAVNSAGNSFDHSLSEWRDTIPFIIELRRYPNELPAPEEFLRKVASEIAHQMPKGWVHKTLESGRALVLVDGLDEVPLQKRSSVIDWLEGIVVSFPEIRIVFTSRPAAYDRGTLEFLNFREYQLAPMQPANINLFVRYWHRAVLGDQDLKSENDTDFVTERLLYKMRNSMPIMRLATNPLLCAMLCALHYERHMQLPADRSTLYEACCSMLIERRDVEREIESTYFPYLSYKQKRVILDDLAYWMMKNRYSSVQSRQALERMVLRLNNMNLDLSNKEANQILSMLLERTGIVREPTPGTIDFVHRTFQEYMAANAATTEGDWGLLINNAEDDQWQETIVLSAGFANKKEADELILGLLNLGESKVTKQHKYELLAVSCLETAVQISTKVRDKVEKRLNALIPPQSDANINSIAAAGNLAVPYLNFNESLSEDEAANCVRILTQIGTRAALTCISTYIGDHRRKVYSAAIELLEQVTPEEVNASGLSDALINDIVQSVDNNNLQLNGIILSALSNVPLSQLGSVLPSTIASLRLLNCQESNLAISTLFPKLKE